MKQYKDKEKAKQVNDLFKKICINEIVSSYNGISDFMRISINYKYTTMPTISSNIMQAYGVEKGIADRVTFLIKNAASVVCRAYNNDIYYYRFEDCRIANDFGLPRIICLDRDKDLIR